MSKFLSTLALFHLITAISHTSGYRVYFPSISTRSGRAEPVNNDDTIDNNYLIQGQRLCDESCICPEEKFKPYCGSDGHTYINECELKCAKRCIPNLKIQFEGVCPEPYVHIEPSERPQRKNKYKGKNSKSNDLNSQEKTIKYAPHTHFSVKIPILEKRPQQSDEPDLEREKPQYYFYKKNGHETQIGTHCATRQFCNCGKSWIPFCGNDFVTYDNICELQCAQINCDPDLRIKYEGVCYVPEYIYMSKKEKWSSTTFRPYYEQSTEKYVEITPKYFSTSPLYSDKFQSTEESTEKINEIVNRDFETTTTTPKSIDIYDYDSLGEFEYVS